MKADNFFYKTGSVETRVPWFPPDPLFLNDWRDEFFETPGVEEYTFWMCGAAMEPWLTSDIDIIVTGEITDYSTLERVLTQAMVLGFKHRQFIDIGWNNYYKKFLERGPCERRAICCEAFFEHGACTLEQCTEQKKNIETIVIGNEIIKNGFVITPADPTAVRLGVSLWKIQFPSPSLKQIERLSSGVVYKSRPVIITADLDFRDFVPWA